MVIGLIEDTDMGFGKRPYTEVIFRIDGQVDMRPGQVVFIVTDGV